MDEYSFEDDDRADLPVFFRETAMSNLPRYDDGNYSYEPKRATPISPYKGYFSDARNVIDKLNREPDANLINQYMSQSWAAAPTTNYVETVAIRRHVSFKENMAIKLYNRHCTRLCRRVYDEWYRFSFRYILLRRHLLVDFQLRYTGKRFYAWRKTARISVQFRKSLKIYWRQHRRLYFRWWKIWTQWEVMKLRVLKNSIDAMIVHTYYQHKIRHKFGGVIQRFYRLRMTIRIQRCYRMYRLRHFFWASKTVKRLFMEYFLIWLVKRRKREEERRQQEEDTACQHMVDRAHMYLRKLLQSPEGSAMMWTYLREVKDRTLDRANRDFVFPDKLDMPEIGMKWTVRGKAMHILRHRVTYEVTEWARANYRRASPPLYYCSRCDEKFVLRAAARHHKMRCRYLHHVPTYSCWKICQPLVDAALGPLVTHFYERQAREEADRAEREQIMRMKSNVLLNQALTGSIEKPKYSQVRAKKPTSSVKVY